MTKKERIEALEIKVAKLEATMAARYYWPSIEPSQIYGKCSNCGGPLTSGHDCWYNGYPTTTNTTNFKQD